MGQHRKLVPTGTDTEATSDIPSRELLENQRDQLADMQATAKATLARDKCSRCGGGASPQLLRESASIARAAATVVAELRRLDLHEIEMDAALPTEELDLVLLTYVEEMAPERLAKFVRRMKEIAAADSHLLAH